MNRLGCQFLPSPALPRDQDTNGAVTDLVNQPQDGANSLTGAKDALSGKSPFNLLPELRVLLLKLVAMPLHLLHHLRRFNSNRRLRRECFQYLFVILVECTCFFIQHLKSSDDLPFMVSQRHGEETPRAISGTKVNLPIKARIMMGILNIDRLSRQGHRSGDA